MLRRGKAVHIDALRDEIERHTAVHIVDMQEYDIRTFNLCDRMGALMVSAPIWEPVHPSLVTLPVDWGFFVPYGLHTVKSPSGVMAEFLKILQGMAEGFGSV